MASSKPSPKQWFFSGVFKGSSNAIDLDLGCFVRLKNGYQDVIQAIGKRFGTLEKSPYVMLLGDDSTGASSSGEWLHINGKYLSEIEEILVFIFIYDGVPNWSKTDGVVTLYVPNEPPIETQLTEGQNNKGMCGTARLVNRNGSIKVERVNQYFSGHKALDEAFGWGFQWTAGSK